MGFISMKIVVNISMIGKYVGNIWEIYGKYGDLWGIFGNYMFTSTKWWDIYAVIYGKYHLVN